MEPSTSHRLAHSLRLVRRVLEQDTAFYARRRFVFELGGGWRLAISPDDAARLRLDVLSEGRIYGTMWTPETDHRRLRSLVVAARDEALALYSH